jgi:hypothetical protein
MTNDTTTRETAGAEGQGQEQETPQVFLEQKGYKGETERVDAGLHTHKLVCACGNVRWVAPGDVFQVKACKPCTQKKRVERRNRKAREKRAAKRVAKAEAVRKMAQEMGIARAA